MTPSPCELDPSLCAGTNAAPGKTSTQQAVLTTQKAVLTTKKAVLTTTKPQGLLTPPPCDVDPSLCGSSVPPATTKAATPAQTTKVSPPPAPTAPPPPTTPPASAAPTTAPPPPTSQAASAAPTTAPPIETPPPLNPETPPPLNTSPQPETPPPLQATTVVGSVPPLPTGGAGTTGAAVDINAATEAYGGTPTTQPSYGAIPANLNPEQLGGVVNPQLIQRSDDQFQFSDGRAIDPTFDRAKDAPNMKIIKVRRGHKKKTNANDDESVVKA